MSDPTDAPSMEARIEALFQHAENTAVRRYGVLRTYARATLGTERHRVFLNADGAIRILAADASGAFLPATHDHERAAALLAKELGEAAPEDAQMDLVQQHEEDLVEEQEERADREATLPAYRL